MVGDTEEPVKGHYACHGPPSDCSTGCSVKCMAVDCLDVRAVWRAARGGRWRLDVKFRASRRVCGPSTLGRDVGTTGSVRRVTVGMACRGADESATCWVNRDRR
jgi:hypothetical protein